MENAFFTNWTSDIITVQVNDHTMPWCLFERLQSLFSNSAKNVFLMENVFQMKIVPR